MRRVLICSLLWLFFNATSYAQQKNTLTTLTKQDYLKKSKQQKTLAWILVTGGTLSTAIGILGSATTDAVGANNSGTTILLISGLAALGTSIPFFIIASKNKKKANSLSLNFNTAPVLQQNNIGSRLYTAVSFNISIK